MTDKQIIIDGVDVSGCEWYFSRYFKPCGGCKNTPDCHYKNWKRKEQECEELKEILKDKTDEYNKLAVNYDAYVSMANEQLDQLKAENETYKKMFENEEVQLALTEIRSGERHLWFNKAEKLSKTLADIKEIAEVYEELHGFLDCSGDLILQKISECEERNV